MKYTCINIQGNFISEEVIQKVETASADFQKATDFGFEPGTNLRDEIEYSWSRIKLDWKHFSEKSDSLPAADQYGTTLARKWMENFFSSIGFDLNKQKEALKGENNQTYTISHASNNNGLPAQIVGFYDPLHPEKNTLDIKSSGGTSRLSPHGTVQEYLNVTEHIYGFATNGMLLRLIRDSGRLVKLTYMEFDLKRMLDEDKYSEFTILYRLIHSSRFNNDATIIEKYYQESIETGNRIRDGLSEAVKESMQALGNGFLQHPANEVLREKLKNKAITPKQYYDQLRRLVYRLLFLMVTEERDLIYDPNELKGDVINKKQIYLRYYSIARLRNLSKNRYLYEKEFTDLWQGLLNTFFLFEATGNGNKIGIKPLHGDLFSEIALKDINGAEIGNHVLLECIRNLNEFQDKETKMLVSINYRSLDVEELGSVYESLLELHPIIEHLDSINSTNIHFTFHGGTERKTTGSYYTRPDLVNELIKSALIPVIEERVKDAGTEKGEKLNALLKLKVCDTAAGSGHIMLAAARTIAWYMARIDSGEENPSPSIYRYWLRQAIQHCIYAVDMNPDAVELCKLALWLEGHNSGKPLSFLDHKIRCGNSLIGVADLSVLKKGIPDEAFNSVTGDDKKVCQFLKKANKDFNKTQQIILDFDDGGIDFKEEQTDFANQFSALDRINQDTLEEVKMISEKHSELKYNPKLQKDKNACDLYTAAFFYTYSKIDDPSAPSSQKLKAYLQSGGGIEARAVGFSNVLSREHNFFHWPLEFPDVFEQGGFDVIIGNPPWEKINLEDLEFFATKSKEISSITKSAERSKAIKKLDQSDPILYKDYQDALIKTNKSINYFKCEVLFKYGNAGLLNTYPLFTELVLKKVNHKGKVGLVIPSGFFGDDTLSPLFRYAVENNFIERIIDFENTKKIFPSVHRQFRFSVVTFNKSIRSKKEFKAKFYVKDIEEAQNEKEFLVFAYEDLKRLNPNNLVCPSFRSQFEFNLNKKLFKYGVLKDEEEIENDVEIHRMINMSADSEVLKNNYFDGSLSLYESKLFYLFDHRYSSFEGVSQEDKNKGNAMDVSEDQKQNTSYKIEPRYFCDKNIFAERNEKWKWNYNWYLAYRVISASTNERTSIASILPASIVSYSAYIIFIKQIKDAILELALMNSLVFDFVARSKVNLNFPPVILQQTPRVRYSDIKNEEFIYIFKRTLELTYTSWDVKSFADSIWREADEEMRLAIAEQWKENKEATGGNKFVLPDWCEKNEMGIKLPPFKWDDERRALLKSELDAIYAKLFDLTKNELCYILDPKDVYGEDFPAETFRVLRDKETKKFGEYRTKRLVLQAWERLSRNTNPVINKPLTITNVDTMKEFNLHEGIYSIKDTAEITGLSKEKIKRWFKELSSEQYEGLDNQQQADVDKMRISFHGLIEVVVIGTLRDNNFSLKKILKARADLFEKTRKIYPFATNNVKEHLKVSGRDIVFEFIDDTKVTLDGTGQINIDFITQFFRDIVFDVDGVAQRLIPSKGKGKVVVDPKEGGGKPSIVGKEVWVDLINNIYTGPDSVTMIKDQYNLDEDEILAAVEFSK